MFPDYLTANGPDITTPLNESQRSDLYAELASGAETGLFRQPNSYTYQKVDVTPTGWDYSSRWLTTVAGGNEGLRTLNVRSIIPVCLNSILCEQTFLLVITVVVVSFLRATR